MAKTSDEAAEAVIPPRQLESGEDRKLFTVYVDCEGAEFQGSQFAVSMSLVLSMIIEHLGNGVLSGAIRSLGDGQMTIGSWRLVWRNADPADRRPRIKRSWEVDAA